MVHIILKSNIILKRIFNNIEKNRALDIMKYNKILQKRLNLSINDYKKYFQLYSPIEIELYNIKSESKFINISNKDEKYYHIYFNNSNEERKIENFLNEEIEKIKIIIDYQIKSFQKLFYYCSFESLIVKKFNRINITDMNLMFFNCKVKELNLLNFKTNNVTNMSYMFYKRNKSF